MVAALRPSSSESTILPAAKIINEPMIRICSLFTLATFLLLVASCSQNEEVAANNAFQNELDLRDSTIVIYGSDTFTIANPIPFGGSMGDVIDSVEVIVNGQAATIFLTESSLSGIDLGEETPALNLSVRLQEQLLQYVIDDSRDLFIELFSGGGTVFTKSDDRPPPITKSMGFHLPDPGDSATTYLSPLTE